MKINRQQITDKVSKLPIEELALQFGFQKRKPRSLSENMLLEQRWPKNGRFKSGEGIKGINWGFK